MENVPFAVNPENLLSHADFIRKLARSLLEDEHRAEDVAQETWMAAIKNPPEAGRPLRGWLAALVRNFARMTMREEGRRSRREKAAARPGTVRSTEEVVERESIRREVVEAVLSLGEPYRSVVLFRFYDDMPPRKIAKQLDTPVATVKTRVQRGLQQLRLRLDEEHGGCRKTWCTALAPLAGMKAAASSAAITATAAAVSATILLGGAFMLWQGTSGKSDEPRKASLTQFAEEKEDRNKSRIPAGERITGIVRDKTTGEPVQEFYCHLQRKESGGYFSDNVRDEEGRFAVPFYSGAIDLTIRSSRHLEMTLEDLEITAEMASTGLEIELDPGLSVSGRVMEDAAGRPVEGAVVGTLAYDQVPLQQLTLGRDVIFVHARTDADGRFTLQGLKGESQKIVVLHPDFVEEWTEVVPGETNDVSFRLASGFRIFGKAYDDRDNPVSGLKINMHGKGDALARPVLTGEDGTYRTPPAGPGPVTLVAGPVQKAPDSPLGFTGEVKRVHIIDRDMEIDFGVSSAEYVTWRGTLYDFDGKPAAGGRLSIHSIRTVPYLNYQGMPGYIVCDDNGRFEVVKMNPGHYRVTLQLPGVGGKSNAHDLGELSFDRPGLVEKDIRITGSVIRGTVVDGRTRQPLTGKGGLVSALLQTPIASKWFSAPFDEEGRFRLAGLPAGTYHVWIHGKGNQERNAAVVDVGENEEVGGLQVVIPPQGLLRLKLSGFHASGFKDVSLYMYRNGASSRQERISLRCNDKKPIERDVSLEPGSWRVAFHFKEEGLFERELEILEDEVTELAVQGDDIWFKGGFIDVSGILTDHDGTAMAGREVTFTPSSVPGSRERKRYRVQGETDEQGRFQVEGLMPGVWKVSVALSNNRTVHFPNVAIHQTSASPFPVDLIIPSGTVDGSLVSGKTGLPLIVEGRIGSVFLLEWNSNRTVSSQSIIKDGAFELAGVPAGRFYLRVDVPGFQEYHSTRILLREGEEMNLGTVALEPSGILDLEVVDEEGSPVVRGYSLYCNDGKCWGAAYPPYQGKTHYDRLPTGPIKVTVWSQGFKKEDIHLHLEPGRVQEMRVVLRRE